MRLSVAILSLIVLPALSLAHTIRATVTYPDNEEKVFVFVPTDGEPSMALNTKTKLTCLMGRDSLGKRPYAFVTCFNGAKKDYHAISTIALCGDHAPAGMRIYEGKTNKLEDQRRTFVLLQCED